MEREVWKEVKGYEGHYRVSNLGNTYGVGNFSCFKQQSNPRLYHCISLKKDGTATNFMVHRLVAAAFIPNPKNKPCVNHKNGIKNDNRAENLEWCTHSENIQHALLTGLIPKKQKFVTVTEKINQYKLWKNITNTTKLLNQNRLAMLNGKGF